MQGSHALLCGSVGGLLCGQPGDEDAGKQLRRCGQRGPRHTAALAVLGDLHSPSFPDVSSRENALFFH